MQKTVRNALLFLAGACLAVSVGLGIFLRPPLKSGVLPGTETPVLTCDGGSDYTLVILADESVPLNRLDPLVRMTRKSGGTSHILRQTDDLEPVRKFADRSESATLLFTYGKSWENALGLLDSSDSIASTVILSPSGDYDPEGLSIQSPVMLLGTSSDQAPTSQRLAEIYNRLSGEKIAPNGLSYTSQSGNYRLRVVSASLDAYQTFSDDTLQAVSDWYEDSAGVRMGDPGAGSLLRLASWALGIGGLLLLLVMLDRLLSEEMLDVGYSLLTLQVTSPVRYSVLKALSCLPALALLLIPALIFLFIPLPGLAPSPSPPPTPTSGVSSPGWAPLPPCCSLLLCSTSAASIPCAFPWADSRPSCSVASPPPWAPPDGSTMPCCWISANSRFRCGSAWNCCPSCPMRVWPSWQSPPSDSPASTP